MPLPYRLDTAAGDVWLVRGGESDVQSILALWDASVAWLVEKGIEGQWGRTPFSQSPGMRERFLAWLRNGELVVAREHNRDTGAIIATLALVDTIPTYAAGAWGPSPDHGLYLEAFTTSRQRQWSGLGRTLLSWAEASMLERGETVLRLDCWAGNAALSAYYRAAGFQPSGTFRLGDWEGQKFEKRLSQHGPEKGNGLTSEE